MSDLAAVIAGGIGSAASGNIDPLTGFGLYEPLRGSAPELTGTTRNAGAAVRAEFA